MNSRRVFLLKLIAVAALLWLAAVPGRSGASADSLTIPDLQGTSDTSPWLDRTVTVSGIVTGLLAETNSRGTTHHSLFLQTPPDDHERDPARSDGIAVYVGQQPPQVAVGDLLRVTGTVVEYYGLTQITNRNQRLERISADLPLPPPLPLHTVDDFESAEAMHVWIENATVQTTTDGCRFSLTLADGRPLPVIPRDNRICADWLLPAPGTALAQISGILTWQFGEWRLVWQEAAAWEAAPEPEPEPEPDPPPAPSDILITELYPHTWGQDDEEEWFEIANIGSSTVDLTDWRVGDALSPDDREGMVRFPSGSRIEPGRAVIIAQTAAGFREAFGFRPDFELRPTDPAVPVLVRDSGWGGAINFANGGDELLLWDADGLLRDQVAYGDSPLWQPAIPPPGQGVSLERIPADCDSDTPYDWQPQRAPSPGVIARGGECRRAERTTRAAPQELPNIGRLQGSGPVSPWLYHHVRFEGVVTGIQEYTNVAGTTYHTLFVQDEPGREDGLPETSDGVAVFTGRRKIEVQPGDLVRVTGQVIDYFGLTEISDRDLHVEIIGHDRLLPSPIELRPPGGPDQERYFEGLEGMRVMVGFLPARVVGPTYSSCGLAVVRGDEATPRFFRRSAADPAPPLIPVLNWSNTRCDQFPAVKTGDEISGLIGPLTYSFDQYRLVVQADTPLIVDQSPLPPVPNAPQPEAGQLSLLSYNVENYFDTLDDTGNDAEPKPTQAELDHKRQRLAHQIALAGCPTVIAVQEVEKALLLAELAQELAPLCDFTYAVVHHESVDVRGIDVAWLLHPERVVVVESRLVPGCSPIRTGIDDPTASCPTGESPLFSRAPLLLSADIDGHRFHLINNHLKSKRGGAIATERMRLAQAGHLAEIARDLLAADGQARLLVLGDFNDFEQSGVTRILQEAGLVDLLAGVPDAQRYSFIFGGEAQLIDGMYGSVAAARALVSADLLPLNADFPAAWATGTPGAHLPWRATDHNPPWLILALEREAGGDVTQSADTPATPPPARQSRLWLVGALLLMGLAGGAGFWFGRKNPPPRP